MPSWQPSAGPVTKELCWLSAAGAKRAHPGVNAPVGRRDALVTSLATCESNTG